MSPQQTSGIFRPRLSRLEVRNFAIIDNQSVDFSTGMTVLTGETGAGKSLLVDALNIVIGERANLDLIQDGAEVAEVNASFEPGPAAHAWLLAQALDDEDGLCALRRVIGPGKRSRAFINGRPVPIAHLRELGACLVDIHGQHAHQSLLKSEVQRQILDHYGNHSALLDGLARTYQQLRDRDAEITQLKNSGHDGGPRIDFLRYQIDELKHLALGPEEFANLCTEHRRLSHGAELITSLAAVLNVLNEDPHCASVRLAIALSQIESLQRLDPTLSEPAQTLSQAQALINEAISDLHHYAENLNPDSTRLEELEQHLSALEDLARKHQCRADQLKVRLQDLEADLELANTADERLGDALKQRAQLFEQYQAVATKLSAKRKSTALQLQAAVNQQLARVGLENACLEIDLIPAAEGQLSAHGAERIELLISTNPGQPLRSLARVASGGELSRIALALQTVAIGDSGVPTIVFDEVDAGIGGRVAEIVGRLMRDLSQHRQVLTVTHLAQVASLAHHHIRVSKLSDQDSSKTSLRELDSTQRIDEIARMLAGVEVTEKSRAHAKEMLAAVPATQ